MKKLLLIGMMFFLAIILVLFLYPRTEAEVYETKIYNWDILGKKHEVNVTENLLTEEKEIIIDDKPFKVDEMFATLESNYADLTYGEAVYSICNNFDFKIPISRSNFGFNTYYAVTPTKNKEIYIEKDGEWIPFDEETLQPMVCYRIKIHEDYEAKLGFNSREWKPFLNLGEFIIEQDRWAWWNSSFDYASSISLDQNQQNESITFYMSDISGFTASTQLQSGCDDIRITEEDNSTQLDYYVDICNSTDARVGFLHPSGTGIQAYVWWNYSLAESQNKTMRMFYDDFNDGIFDNATGTGAWYKTGQCTGTIIEGGGMLNQTSAGAQSSCALFWHQNTTIMQNQTAYSKIRFHADAGSTGIGVATINCTGSCNQARMLVRRYDDSTEVALDNEQSANGAGVAVSGLAANVWWWGKIYQNGSTTTGKAWVATNDEPTADIVLASYATRPGYFAMYPTSTASTAQSYDDFQVWAAGYRPFFFATSSTVTLSAAEQRIVPPPNATILNVTLNYPATGSTNTSLTISHGFTPVWTVDLNIKNCSLFNNDTSWSLKASNYIFLTNNTPNYINHTYSLAGWYNWNVRCSNSSSNIFADSNWTLFIDTNIPPAYSSNSTNSTIAGTWISHNLKWTDTLGLSGNIFQFCNGYWDGASCLSGANYTNYTNISANTSIFDGNASYSLHTFQPIHSSYVQEFNHTGYRYWSYYLATGLTPYIAKSQDLETWVDFGAIVTGLGGQGHWPSVTNTSGLLHMFYCDNSCSGANAHIARATSTNGTHFTIVEDVTPAGSTTSNPFIWYNPNDNYWYLFFTDASGAGYKVMYKRATTIEDLDLATAIDTNIPQSPSQAACSITYYDGYYRMLCEEAILNEYKVTAFYSTNMNGTWEFSPNGNPLLPPEGSYSGTCCPIQLINDTKIHVWFEAWEGGSPPWDLLYTWGNITTSTSTGGTGWTNDTWVSMIGTTNYSNTSKLVTDTTGADVAWRVYANDTSDNWNTSQLYTYATTTNLSAIYLWLGGTQGNKAYTQYQIANFTAQSTVIGLTVNISTNITGWTEPTGTTTVLNTTNMTTVGVYNITGYTLGNATISSSSTTYYATVTTSDPPPSYSNIQTGYPATYSAQLTYMNVTWTDTGLAPVDTVLIESDFSGSYVNYTASNSSSIYFWSATLPVGTWHWKSYANDTLNQWNTSTQQTFTINKASPSLSVSANTSWTVYYPTATNVSGNGCPTVLTCNLYRNGVSIGTPDDNQLLSAGNYIYIYNTSGNANYSSKSVSNTLVVLTGGVSVGGLTMTYNRTTNIDGNSIWNETWNSAGNKTFYVNIPKNATVNSANINLSGFENRIYYTYSPVTYTGMTGITLYEAVGQNFTMPEDGTIWKLRLRCSQASGIVKNLSIHSSNFDGTVLGNSTVSCSSEGGWGYITGLLNTNVSATKNTVYYIQSYNITPYTGTQPFIGVGSGDSYPNHIFSKKQSGSWSIFADGSYDLYFELYYYNLSNTTNPYLDVANDGDKQWEYSGDFNQMNNQTSDFSSEINSYLRICVPYTDGTCDVPFILHSDTAGIIQVKLDTTITYDTETYDSLIYEGQTADFWIQANSTTDITDVNATLMWNNTKYSYSSKNQDGVYWTFTRDLAMPAVPSNTNITFHWNFTYVNSTGTYQQNATSHTQQILHFALSDCTGTDAILNFTTYDEENKAQLYFNMDIDMDYVSGTATGNYSHSFTGNNTYFICLGSGITSILADATIKYWNASYPIRYYYLQNINLSSTTTNINFYLHDEAKSVQYFVVNEVMIGQSDVLIQVERYFIGTGTYPLVAEGMTDSNGYAYINLKQNEWYKYVLIQNGVVLKTFSPMYLNQTSYTLQISSIEGAALLNYFGSIAYTSPCPFNNASGVISCTITDTSGKMLESYLTVKELGGATICTTSSTSPSVTLTCTLPNDNRTYSYSFVGRFSGSDSWFSYANNIINRITYIVSEGVYGLTGVIAGIFLVLGTFFVGLWNPVVSIVLGMGGLSSGYLLGLFGTTPNTITVVIGVIIMGVFIMHKLRS